MLSCGFLLNFFKSCKIGDSTRGPLPMPSLTLHLQMAALMRSKCTPTHLSVSVDHPSMMRVRSLHFHIKSEFVSSDDSNFVSWNTSLTTKSIIHMAQQRTLRNLVENNDMSEDGSQIFAYTGVFHFTHCARTLLMLKLLDSQCLYDMADCLS